MKVVLAKREVELNNCKKNTLQTDADVVKKLEADKAKAENDARIAKKQTDSLTVLLVQKTAEYDNCKKNSTLSNAEVVKKLEAEKAKAENDAKVAKKQSINCWDFTYVEAEGRVYVFVTNKISGGQKNPQNRLKCRLVAV